MKYLMKLLTEPTQNNIIEKTEDGKYIICGVIQTFDTKHYGRGLYD